MSESIDIDSIIQRLLEVRGSKPGKQVNLTEAEIRYFRTFVASSKCHVSEYTSHDALFLFLALLFSISYLCTKSREIFSSQPILLELVAPIKIVGIIGVPHYY